VETTLSLGLMSFGMLALMPLLAVGLKAAHDSNGERDTAQIAETLVEQAKQGSLAATTYLDFQGNSCAPAEAAYTAQATSQAEPTNARLARLTLRLVPAGDPNRARTYVVVFAPAS
jgi:hypothetical protein